MIIMVAIKDGPVRQLVITRRTNMLAVHNVLQLAALPPPGVRQAHHRSLQPCGTIAVTVLAYPSKRSFTGVPLAPCAAASHTAPDFRT